MASLHKWMAMALLAHCAALPAEIVVSANDGKARPADSPDAPRTPDSVTILDVARGSVRTLATVLAPASLAGPPGSVALTHDSRLAVITAATMLDQAGALVPGDTVSVLDLSSPAAARVVQTLHSGSGASGVAINRSGTLALVANAGDDSVTIFAIRDERLERIGSVTMAPKSRPVDVAFTRDGRSAFVVTQAAGSLVPLRVDGQRVTTSGAPIAIGSTPYSLALSPDGAFAFASTLVGPAGAAEPAPKRGGISIVDLRAGRLVRQIDTAITPEHVGLSPSGRYLHSVAHNGSLAPVGSPAFHDYGLLTIYSAQGGSLDQVAQTRIGPWCQGAAWSSDGRTIMVQCSARKQIEFYRFDGKRLTSDTKATVQLDARPGAIATARSR